MSYLSLSKYFKSLLEKESNSNASYATIQLVKQLKVPVTSATIIEVLEQHPDFPSLLSISDSLKQWKIENLALHIEPEKLEELPTPFIAHTKSGGGKFVLVNSVNGAVNYIDEKGKQQNKVKDEFLKDWNQVALLAEANENSGQKKYAEERRKEIFERLRIPAILFACLLLVVLYALAQTTEGGLWRALLLLAKLTGGIVTSLLLWFEIDKSNPVLQQICSSGKNTSCTAILSSKKAKLFNWVSWSEIGFIYFVGGFLFLFSSVNYYQSSLPIVSWVNLFALPYTVFSVFYQWRIAKQWCPLCLVVQTLLVVEFAIANFGYWDNFSSHPAILSLLKDQLLVLFTSFLLPIFFWVATKKAYVGAQNGKQYQKELSRLKYNKEIFSALLEKQKAVTTIPEGLGITLGNPTAKNTIIKVCNPYCGPCAKAHTIIDEILEVSKDVKVQIIFTATNDDEDIKGKPVKHFMALYEKNNARLMQKALDDWYGAEKKDYEVFARKYRLNNELQKQGEKLEKMDKWCKETGISFTPTVFVNGYQLPDVYKIQDINYLL